MLNLEKIVKKKGIGLNLCLEVTGGNFRRKEMAITGSKKWQ
jgi:hypothetical protein